jgi:ATP-dependent Clp endopeptidase proteolytic subunit ClpP
MIDRDHSRQEGTVMEGKTERKWYDLKTDGGSTAEVWIYEQIGADFWGEGLTAKQFVEDIGALDVDHIALHINSPGGSVFDGQAIFNAIERHPASVTSYVDGLAASIASVVALAGDTVEMATNALFMVHDPYGVAMGTSSDMVQMAGVLDKVAATIVGIYAAKTGADPEQIAADMAAETWYTAAEALAAGYADRVGKPVKAAAMTHFDLSAFRHPPQIANDDDAEDDSAALGAPDEPPALEAAVLQERISARFAGTKALSRRS